MPESLLQNAGVSNSEWQNLESRVAEPLVQNCKVSSAEWQSIQCRVAMSPVQSGIVSSAECQSLRCRVPESPVRVVEWQSLQCRLAECPMQNGRVSSAEWQSVLFRVTPRSEFPRQKCQSAELFPPLTTPASLPPLLIFLPCRVAESPVQSTYEFQNLRIPESPRLESAVDANNRSFLI